MKGDAVRTCIGECIHPSLRLDDHQVHVDGQRRSGPGRMKDRQANRNVRHEPAIHDVEMHIVGAGIFDLAQLITERQEIRREYRRADPDSAPG